MATSEYDELYIKAQQKGIYHMFVFDIKESSTMDSDDRYIAQQLMIELMGRIYNNLEILEKDLIKKILVKENNFRCWSERNLANEGFGFKIEPFVIGDLFGFTIYRNSINKEIIYDLFYKFKKELNIKFDFHIEDGFYETNNYEDGNDKYFRGYCIDKLSKMHKKEEDINKAFKI